MKPFKLQKRVFPPCSSLNTFKYFYEEKNTLYIQTYDLFRSFSFKQVPRLRHLPLQAEVPLVARGGPRIRGNIQDGGGGGAQASLDQLLSIRTVREGGAGHYKKSNFI